MDSMVKIRYCWLLLLLQIAVFTGCNDSELPVYNDIARVRIAGGGGSYSFVFKKSDILCDTLWFDVALVGLPENRDRRFTLVSHPENKMDTVVVKNEAGEAVDTNIYNTNAIPGVHYVGLDDPWVYSKMVIPANKVSCKVPIIIQRDTTMRETAYRLRLRLEASEDLALGMPENLQVSYSFTDQLIEPKNWGFTISYFGSYSKVKYRFIIDVTGYEWSEKFIGDIKDVAEQLFYKDWMRLALSEYNADPKNNGPLRDEYNKLVEFPK